MADGASGNIGGILFEAGKTISDAGKKQAQQIANAAGQQLTGSQKPLFGGGPKQTTTGLPSFKPQAGGAGQMPKLDPFGDFGKMFEKNKPGSQFGAKQPASPFPQSQQFSQEELDKMAAENSAKDQEEIAKRQAELKQLTQQLHNENYYNEIRDAGKGLAEKARQAQAQQAEEDAAQQQVDAQQDQMRSLPNGVLKNELPPPDQQESVALTQAKTQTEANRGTTG
jgi:hypothetical protein